MGQFGEKLRRERELRGITLEEVAVATKIGTRNLRALEEEKFSQLPGGIFNKGFVRAYAHYVGIDEEQAVGDYLAANQELESSSEVNIYVVARQFEASRDVGYGTRRHGATTLVWSLEIPSGVNSMLDLDKAGGIPGVLKSLESKLAMDVITCTNQVFSGEY